MTRYTTAARLPDASESASAMPPSAAAGRRHPGHGKPDGPRAAKHGLAVMLFRLLRPLWRCPQPSAGT